MERKHARILIVSASEKDQSYIRQAVEACGHIPAGITPRGETAAEMARVLCADIVLLDMQPAGDCGAVAAAADIAAGTQAGVIFMASSEAEAFPAVKSSPGSLYLLKPLNRHELELAAELSLLRSSSRREVEEAETAFGFLFAGATCGILELDGLTVRAANPAAAALLRYSDDAILQRSAAALCVQESAGPFLEAVKRSSLSSPEEARLLCGDGVARWFVFRTIPIVRAGRPVTLLCLNDVNRLKAAEGELKLYSQRLADLVESRTAVLRKRDQSTVLGEAAVMVGHDLRGPAQAVLSASSSLRQAVARASLSSDAASPMLTEITRLKRQAGCMIQSVTSMLEAAAMRPSRLESLNPDALLKDVAAMTVLPEKVRLEVSPVAGSETLMADHELLRAAMFSLIAFSSRHMSDGGVVRVSATPYKEKWRITVAGDKAPGADEPSDRQGFSINGSLALLLVKKIVDEHGGTMIMDARSGDNVSVHIELPRKLQVQG